MARQVDDPRALGYALAGHCDVIAGPDSSARPPRGTPTRSSGSDWSRRPAVGAARPPAAARGAAGGRARSAKPTPRSSGSHGWPIDCASRSTAGTCPCGGDAGPDAAGARRGGSMARRGGGTRGARPQQQRHRAHLHPVVGAPAIRGAISPRPARRWPTCSDGGRVGASRHRRSQSCRGGATRRPRQGARPPPAVAICAGPRRGAGTPSGCRSRPSWRKLLCSSARATRPRSCTTQLRPYAHLFCVEGIGAAVTGSVAWYLAIAGRLPGPRRRRRRLRGSRRERRIGGSGSSATPRCWRTAGRARAARPGRRPRGSGVARAGGRHLGRVVRRATVRLRDSKGLRRHRRPARPAGTGGALPGTHGRRRRRAASRGRRSTSRLGGRTSGGSASSRRTSTTLARRTTRSAPSGPRPSSTPSSRSSPRRSVCRAGSGPRGRRRSGPGRRWAGASAPPCAMRRRCTPSSGVICENAVRTGTWCSYRPEAAVRWDVDAG